MLHPIMKLYLIAWMPSSLVEFSDRQGIPCFPWNIRLALFDLSRTNTVPCRSDHDVSDRVPHIRGNI